jgi:hypothetical protein
MKKRKNHGDKETAELMSKKSKNHGKNHGDKEVVEVINEKSSDDDNDCDDDDDDDDDELVGKTEDHKKPEVFQSKSTLEIVAWLIDHPEILRLALEMNKTDVAISSSSKITDVSIKLT